MRLSPALGSAPGIPSQGAERHGSAATQTGARSSPRLGGLGVGGLCMVWAWLHAAEDRQVSKGTFGRAYCLHDEST